MRKYLLSVVLILAGFVLLILNQYQKKNLSYTEAEFSKLSVKFDEAFEGFTGQVVSLMQSVHDSFPDTLKVRDSVKTRLYFSNVLEKHPYLLSVGFFQNKYRLVFRREGSSMLYALDSTELVDVVKWKRFEKGKQVSSWYQSFDYSIDSSGWYRDLYTNKNRIKWFQPKDLERSQSRLGNRQVLYIGNSFSTGETTSIILLEFLVEDLAGHLGIGKNSRSRTVTLITDDRHALHLNYGTDLAVDSLGMVIKRHFERFGNVPSGTYSFNYGSEVYWNSFASLPPESGLRSHLITMAESDLKGPLTGGGQNIWNWSGGLLILFGLVLLVVRKRYFYRPNRMDIPSLEEILREDESRFLEFKSSLRWDYRQEKTNPDLENIILKTIAAFGNTDGGILVIGVDDDKKPLGLDRDFRTLKRTDADYYEIHLRNVLHKAMGVKYVSKYIRTQFETLEDDKCICKVRVIAADEPLFLKFRNKSGLLEEKFYVRSGNTSQEIESMAEINDYINKKFKK